MDGWIKLHRKILDSDMYRSLNSKQRDVLITLLLMANHKENQWEYKGEIYTAEAGQTVTSLDSIERNCAKDVTTQNIRTALKKLETWGFLTNKSTKTGRLITIVNWRVYQSEEEETNKDINNELTKDQQRGNKELTPNKNVKNDKNDKEEKTLTPKKRKQENLTSIDDIKTFVESQMTSNPLPVNRKLIINYINTLRLTRKTARISNKLVKTNWEKWKKYKPDVIAYAMWKHIDKHDDKGEAYTLGIMRQTDEHEARRQLIWMKNKDQYQGGQAYENDSRNESYGHDQGTDTDFEDPIKGSIYDVPGLFAN